MREEVTFLPYFAFGTFFARPLVNGEVIFGVAPLPFTSVALPPPFPAIDASFLLAAGETPTSYTAASELSGGRSPTYHTLEQALATRRLV